ncbi:hypothetical protein ARMSODRAFT_978243 [Armillaria solidipes]|uniref:Secreted protein n=1 Tax=Armillaria solidipes TaxID=1076256 RepID=A0A2H3B981_9AGAR|nr:hypothetical protein ARMSODRAFT_978243 [Armillaria solidipes]
MCCFLLLAWLWRFWWVCVSVGMVVPVDEDGDDSDTCGAGDGGGVIFGVVGGEASKGSRASSRSTQLRRRAGKLKSELALTTGKVVPSHGEKWAPDLVYLQMSLWNTCRKQQPGTHVFSGLSIRKFKATATGVDATAHVNGQRS